MALERSPRFAMVAGEASGDLLAGLLLGGLRARWPGLDVAGIGGPKMAAQGFDAWWPSDKLAVRGYVEVLRHYREIAGIRERLALRVLRERPDLFIGVDAPDFNLDLEASSNRRHQGGALRQPVDLGLAGSASSDPRSVDHMPCLSVEPALYEAQGILASYVGHPLADAIPPSRRVRPAVPRWAWRRTMRGRAAAGQPLLGDRVRRARLLGAAARMRRQRPSCAVLPVAPGLRTWSSRCTGPCS
jgi:lipid-A-disaccharide synthase